jgi:uncharacterized protein YegL
MGFAKYQEDIVSRRVADNRSKATRRRIQPKAPVVATAAPVDADSSGSSQAAIQKEETVSKLKEFTMSSARPLPVIVLADISGSMGTNGKIDALNEAVAEMVSTFAEEDDTRAEIHVSVITFGKGGAAVHKPLKPAPDTTWEPMDAAGRTPMGEAFALAQQMIEDKNIVPSRAYRPTLVLVSDGVPTDDWQGPLQNLLDSERASKAMRFAMGIGADADSKTLAAFLDNDEGRVFEAHEAREIKKFFRWVTMSVTTRSRSSNPNSVVAIEPTDLDDFDF